MANDTDRNIEQSTRTASSRGSAAVGDDDDVAFAVMAGVAVLAAVILLLTGLLDTGDSTTTARSSGSESAASEISGITTAAAVSVVATSSGVTLSGTVPDEATAEQIRSAVAANFEAGQIVDELEVVEGASPFTLTLSGETGDEDSLEGLTNSFEELGLGSDLTNELVASSAGNADDDASGESADGVDDNSDSSSNNDSEEDSAEEGAADGDGADAGDSEDSSDEADGGNENSGQADSDAGVGAANVVITATDDAISLDGVVPTEAMADKLRSAAALSYEAGQITDNLVVVDGASPFTIERAGEVSSADTIENLSGALGALDLDQDITDGLALSEGGGIVAALNELVLLDPILFETGSATIAAESQTTLDKAAAILIEFPSAVVEIGGHTDSRGGAAGNEALSDARAQSVAAALAQRGVTNELTAVGYGEEQLKHAPDDTLELQQLNRRIEFKIL